MGNLNVRIIDEGSQDPEAWFLLVLIMGGGLYMYLTLNDAIDLVRCSKHWQSQLEHDEAWKSS